jgi:GT2 family glycosyltransferase
MNPKISILLPAYKSEYLFCKIFNKGFRKNIKENVELVVYDNGGNGGTFLPYICCVNHMWQSLNLSFKIVGNGENVGLNKALNECAKVATGDYFYLPHTDMYMMPNCLESLVAEAKKHAPHTFLFCSRSVEPNYSHIPSQIIKNYGNEIENFNETKLLEDFINYNQSDIIVNARMPFFMHRKLWDKIGGVDEKLWSYCTDDDLIQQCYDVGVRKFWMLYNSLVYHLSGKSNSQQNVDKDKDWPYEYFINKWKDKYPNIHHPGQYHPRLIPFEMKIK